MTASLEANDQLIWCHFDESLGRDEEAVELLGSRLLVAPQMLAEPPVAAIGQNSKRCVQVHVESDLACQTVEMEEVHTDPKTILYAITARVTDDDISSRLLFCDLREPSVYILLQPRQRDLGALERPNSRAKRRLKGTIADRPMCFRIVHLPPKGAKIN